MAKKNKNDSVEPTQEDIMMLNQGISPAHHNYIQGLEDPKLEKLKQYPGFNDLIIQLRIDANKSEKSTQEKNRAHIDRVLNRILKEAGSSKALPAEQRPAKLSMRDYLKQGRAGLRQDPRFTEAQKKAIADSFDIEYEKSISALRDMPKADKHAPIQDLTDAFQTEEYTKLEQELKEYKQKVSQALSIIRKAVGKEHASKFQHFPENIVKLLRLIQYNNKIRNNLETRLKEEQEQGKERKFLASDLANSFFNIFSGAYFPDPVEGRGYAEFFEKPVLKLLSGYGSDDVEIIQEPEKPVKVNFLDDSAANKVLSEVVKKYDALFADARSNLTRLRTVVDDLKHELEKRNISPIEIDRIIKKAEVNGNMPAKHLEIRRQIDKDIHELNKQDLAVLYHDTKNKLDEANRIIDILQSQKSGLSGRRGDIIRVITKLAEISQVIETGGFYDSQAGVGPNTTSSKIIESIPEELETIQSGIEEKLNYINELENQVTEQKDIIDSQKTELKNKKKPVLVLDPFFNTMYKQFSKVNNVFKKYALANGFVPEDLTRVSFKSKDAVVVLLDNYKSLLGQLKDIIEVDIVNPEKNLQQNLADSIKSLPGSLRRKKDIGIIRKKAADLLESENKRKKRQVIAGKTLVSKLMEYGKINEKVLLGKTGYSRADINCMASYVMPLHERVSEISALPVKPQELVEKYSNEKCSFDSFEALKELADDLYSRVEAKESVFRDAQKMASDIPDVSVRTRKDAVSFVKNLKADIDEADIGVEGEKKEIMKECILPKASYDQFCAWLNKAYERLSPFVEAEKAGRKTVSRIGAKIAESEDSQYQAGFEFLQGFVNDAGFRQIDEDLSYFNPLKDIFKQDFVSGQELLKAVKDEIKQVNKYLKTEQKRLKSINNH